MSRCWRNEVLTGDALARLRELPPGSIDCVITSPPYFQLRDYGGGGAEIGREATVADWVASLRAVCVELARVLAVHGSLWLNLGDAYSRHRRYGAPAKSLLLGPERLLLALCEDGWLLRNKVAWCKTNCRPSSARDRLTPRWEPIYLLTRNPRYFFDLDAIRLGIELNPAYVALAKARLATARGCRGGADAHQPQHPAI